MAKQSASSEPLSHPDKTLFEHLQGTKQLAELFWREKKVDSTLSAQLPKFLEVVSLCHDLGKITPFFQEHLKGKRSRGDPLTKHSFLSALFVYQWLRREAEAPFLPFLAFVAVRRHHSHLRDIMDEILSIEDEKDVAEAQIKAIPEGPFRDLVERLGLPISLEEAYKTLEVLLDDRRQLKRFFRKEQGLDLYLFLNLLYSLLLDADRMDVVIGKERLPQRLNISSELVERYKGKQNWEDSFINSIREKAYKEVLSQEIIADERIFTLTLPTGMGKTLTAFAFALKLREKLLKEMGMMPRIVYCLPFLSIIEQNWQVLRDVMETNDSKALLKHHHLTELRYEEEKGEFTDDQAKLLIEGWNSEVIITTFVQFFHTLVSYHNRTLRKFHRLSNAIIILDEVQAIPHRYWLLCKELLTSLAQHLNSYIVLVTATQPMIFHKARELVQERERYFNTFNRVLLIPRIEERRTLEDFLEEIQISPSQRCLFILNTIASARELYNLLVKRFGRKNITYLSTHIVPKERLERIGKIREGRYKIVVSTQLVEAGVDIDFPILYRDLAPLDCLIQSAGRCNRNDRQLGKIFVVRLGKNNRDFASYVYDPVLCDITKELLSKWEEIPESKFHHLMEEYYRKIQERGSQDESENLLSAVKLLRYEGDEAPAISHFRLIVEDYPKLAMFVELDKEAEKVWGEYLALKEIKDLWERRNAFERIKSRFYQYVISVPQFSKRLPPEVEGFLYVSKGDLRDYYDPYTGFKCEEETAIW